MCGPTRLAATGFGIANWSPNALPGPTDTAWVTNNGTYTVTLDGSAMIASLHLGGTSGTQTLSHASGLLTLGGDSTASANGAYILNGGTLDGSGKLSLAASFTWLAGNLGSAGSSLTVAANGGVALSGTSKNFNGGTLVNAGAGSWSGGPLSCYNNPLFTNAPSGTFDFQADGNALAQFGSAVLANAGTLSKSAGTGITTVGAACYNSGLIQARSGLLNLIGGGTNSGQFVCDGPGMLGFGGGTHLLQSASSVTGPGAVWVSADTLNVQGQFAVGSLTNGGGTVNFSSGGTPIVTNLILNSESGSLVGIDAITVVGVFNWTFGNFGGVGNNSLTLTANGGIVLSGGDKYFNGGTLINAGAGSWSGGFVYCYNNPLFTNAPGGSLDLQSDGDPFRQYGSGVLANAGTLRKSAGAGTTTIELPCYNSGLIQAQSGLLNLTGGATNSGQFECDSAGTLGFGGGTYWLQNGSSVTGAGVVSLSAGTLNIQGPVAVGSVTDTWGLTLEGGALLGSGAVTVPGAFNWISGNFGGVDNSLTLIAKGGIVLSGGYKYFNGGTLVNAGAGSWSGGNVYFYNNPIFTNAPGGSLDLQSDGDPFRQYGSGVLANAGTLGKSAGAGTTTIELPCYNSGLIQAQSGLLNLTGGGTNSGQFVCADAGALGFGGGTYLLQGASSVTGPGAVSVSGGTVNVQGQFAVGSLTNTGGIVNFSSGGMPMATNLAMNGGSLIGSDAVMVGGVFNWSSGIFGGIDSSHPTSLTLTAIGGLA